ncbi:MAG: DNA repair protein RadC [Pseudomonadota bacterium]
MVDYPESEPTGMAEAPVPHYHGHRDRLRERFLMGHDNMPDYEILELLLYRSLPRRDTKPIAKALLQRFSTLAAVLRAEIKDLQQVKGVGHSVAMDLKIVAAASTRGLRSDISGKTMLSSWSSVIDYCTAAMGHAKVEEFRILFLDRKNALIVDEVQQRGTVDHTPVYPREVVKRALDHAATAIILVHNHPSDDITPSTADIQMTHKIIETAAPMGIVVHDHIIIGRNEHASMKALQLI